MSLPRRPSSPNLLCTSRWSSSPTPTPPPVTVSTDSQPLEEPAPLVEESRAGARVGGWALVPLLVLACLASAIAWRTLEVSEWLAPKLADATETKGAAAMADQLSEVLNGEEKTAKRRGSWRIRHEGHVPIPGGVLLFPKDFAPDKDGGYDLVIHFHGNVDIVRESFAHVRLNAALAVINHGIRSAAYRKPYTAPGTFEELMERIEAGVKRRGVTTPQLRRLALTSWSAGYAAIESILEHRRAPHADRDPLDAILALDGVHASFADGNPKKLNRRSIDTLVHAARAAAEEQLLFVATHSQIDPGDYASAKRTQSFLLEQVGSQIKESPLLPMPEHLSLPAAKGAVKKQRRMIPTSLTRVGQLIIKGYDGETADHHSAHLTQMAAVALPELVERWNQQDR